MATTAARRHYLGLNQRNRNSFEWICHRPWSYIFISSAQREFANSQPTIASLFKLLTLPPFWKSKFFTIIAAVWPQCTFPSLQGNCLFSKKPICLVYIIGNKSRENVRSQQWLRISDWFCTAVSRKIVFINLCHLCWKCCYRFPHLTLSISSCQSLSFPSNTLSWMNLWLFQRLHCTFLLLVFFHASRVISKSCSSCCNYTRGRRPVVKRKKKKDVMSVRIKFSFCFLTCQIERLI